MLLFAALADMVRLSVPGKVSRAQTVVRGVGSVGAGSVRRGFRKNAILLGAGSHQEVSWKPFPLLDPGRYVLVIPAGPQTVVTPTAFGCDPVIASPGLGPA